MRKGVYCDRNTRIDSLADYCATQIAKIMNPAASDLELEKFWTEMQQDMVRHCCASEAVVSIASMHQLIPAYVVQGKSGNQTIELNGKDTHQATHPHAKLLYKATKLNWLGRLASVSFESFQSGFHCCWIS